jgi:DNA-binding NarL/FixJ family response regulator
MNDITVLIADDHAIVREGLRALLALEPDIRIVGEATNGQQAVALSHELVPDIVILDLAMPLLNGMDAIKRIQACTTSSTKLLILSSYADPAYIRHVESLGASGYLAKQSDAHLIATAIRRIHNGGTYFTPTHHLPVQCP